MGATRVTTFRADPKQPLSEHPICPAKCSARVGPWNVGSETAKATSKPAKPLQPRNTEAKSLDYRALATGGGYDLRQSVWRPFKMGQTQEQIRRPQRGPEPGTKKSGGLREGRTQEPASKEQETGQQTAQLMYSSSQVQQVSNTRP
ncbi:hypothetical protein AVEN_148524-1 [Araneus ventricosus]|uniref:Uncharacterized protein n=1 Tax=Araneus ventricosus TaxID=182803 RepID=A0A4Y2WBA5_ARAVE|nr:hypothetical protein AVEN_148524-1 [Araneus ventricosus]